MLGGVAAGRPTYRNFGFECTEIRNATVVRKCCRYINFNKFQCQYAIRGIEKSPGVVQYCCFPTPDQPTVDTTILLLVQIGSADLIEVFEEAKCLSDCFFNRTSESESAATPIRPTEYMVYHYSLKSFCEIK